MTSIAPNRSNILLSRQEYPFVGWAAIDEFENMFSRLCDCRIVVPVSRRPLPWFLDRLRNKIQRSFVSISECLPGGDLLLVIARTPGDLHMIYSLGDARKRFRYVAGFVIDSFFSGGFGPGTRLFDHIFSTSEEGAETVRRRFGVPSSVLRQGFDCLNWSCIDDARCIDLIGFGRQPPSYHHAFQARFHKKDSQLLYLHSPIGTTTGPAVWDERPMLFKLLQRSKISLAFNLDVEPYRVRPGASGFVTSRWFESLASGCVVVGKRPLGPMADDMFFWPDATIDLPDDPLAAPQAIEELASELPLLRSIRARNVLEMSRHHDWRYRIRDIYQHFGMDLPSPLTRELLALEQLCARL
jgi:hypothetical protein